MFKSKKIKYFKIKKFPSENLFEKKSSESLFIKYKGEEEQFLTSGRVDLEDFIEKQRPFYEKARAEVLEKSKGWEKRYQNYLNNYAKPK